MNEDMIDLYGTLMVQAVLLNQYKNVDVYLCQQGNTEVIALTVEENKTQVYNRKEFIHDTEKIRAMQKDIDAMIKCRENENAIQKVQ